MVGGRAVLVTHAVGKDEIAGKGSGGGGVGGEGVLGKGKKGGKEGDKRNLYLAQEGLIQEGTPAYLGMSKQDAEKRRR